ncbi:uncharacterized protein [Typha latifolia]|uniref:uncharacterized protein n=1 Tax=Typha latifolia TaxID=4733 RepID=UPI003C2C0374
MGNSLRCCLACVLPCGAFDLIRIVHLNGHIEEYSRPVKACQILAANPNHVLSRPCSQGIVRRILVVAPESELQRGHIYFLIPASSLPEKKKKKKIRKKKKIQRSNNQNSLSDASIIPDKRSGHRRRRQSSDCVAVWQPHLDSIHEDP